MAIVAAELKLYKSVTVSDASGNGGRMSSTEAVDNVKNNVWPDVPHSERTAGSTKYRKLFMKVANDDDLSLMTSRLFVERHTPGDDRVVMFAGTQTDTQNDITGSERLYGCGQLNADIGAGATSIVVNCESTDAIFADGDLIRISDKTDINDAGGNEEFLRLASSSAVSWNGSQATLTLAAGVATYSAYAATATRVASVLEAGTIAGSVTGWSENSASGTYDEATYPVLVDHIGTVEDSWTVTFTGATTFNVAGSNTGSVGSGTTGSDFVPTNGSFSKPYFTLRSAGWGGTWQSGDTVFFTTHPAASPVWEKRVVPAGANSISGNKVVLAIAGESE